MALRPLLSNSLLQTLLPVSNALVRQTSIPILRQFRLPSQPSLAIPIPFAAISGASIVLKDIWESILRAVPKKKTSHMKRRHRFMAGKALKDLTELNKCPSCGRVKRAHLLCPYCVQDVKDWFKGRFSTSSAKTTETKAE
ncbi:hypothetical protein M501DRAFT_1001613 [Patellaria atrata CBS 101060]|uniref:Large ribosomal subunit protein bL32m n=1 Tax=Patellaria atrata CBS 101060 TaxID=1346257 RepID=A0A9P4VPA2_9PEZI|nr:hypothetical protein M501DRAFT_1001613 [Patellaria atrata CBS 101060]